MKSYMAKGGRLTMGRRMATLTFELECGLIMTLTAVMRLPKIPREQTNALQAAICTDVHPRVCVYTDSVS